MSKGINTNTVLLQVRNQMLTVLNAEDFAFSGVSYQKKSDSYIDEVYTPVYSTAECDNKTPYLESVYQLKFKNKKELNINWIEDRIAEAIALLDSINILINGTVVTEIINYTTGQYEYDDVFVSKNLRVYLQTRIRN